LQQNQPDDYVLATGEAHTVRDFIENAFLEIGETIIWKGKGEEEIGLSQNTNKILIEVDKRYFRPTEVNYLLGDATKAKTILGWEANVKFSELVKEMVKEDLKLVDLEQKTRRFGIDG
jgi:GDPmannose 4,6-dehydratase